MEYTVKNGLSSKEFNQDELQSWMAFSVYFWDRETSEYNQEIKEDLDSYIHIYAGVWNETGTRFFGPDMAIERELKIHKCNETDKKFLS